MLQKQSHYAQIRACLIPVQDPLVLCPSDLCLFTKMEVISAGPEKVNATLARDEPKTVGISFRIATLIQKDWKQLTVVPPTSITLALLIMSTPNLEPY